MGKRLKTGLIILITLAGMGGPAFAEVAASVNPGSFEPGYPIPPADMSIGWRFFVEKTMRVTHLGIFDWGDDGLAGSHTVALWRLPATGGFELLASASIGPGGEQGDPGDHHRWVDIDDIVLTPDPTRTERYLLGVWTGSGDGDGLIIRPREAASVTNAITIQAYSWVDTSVFGPPWGRTSDYDYFGVNFKFTTNERPTANAGEDISITSAAQLTTEIEGLGTDPDLDAIEYRWVENSEVLQDWTAVGPAGEANLNLATLPYLSIGAHTLTLEVNDGEETASDSMVLTVVNTPPAGQPAPGSQTLEFGIDPIIIVADISDFDGDVVSYQWVMNGTVLASGSIETIRGGDAVTIPDMSLPAGDPRFPVGSHTVELLLNDGVNETVSDSVTVEIVDSTAPTLSPVPSTTILWPPNGRLHPVTIWANAFDNGGGPITLSVSVQSNEPPDGHCHDRCHDHGRADFYIDSVDNETGVIELRLRAERCGRHREGRTYTITITATDESGNFSTAQVRIRVPHDRRGRCW